jgi:prepilin-type N-terminal cleavage/methylation domain-containing protein
MFQSALARLSNADAEKGFSLMEVLVAIIVLTIGLMSAAMLMANVYRLTVRSRYVALAAQLASEELEDLNRWPNNTNTTFIDPHITVPAGSTCGLGGETCIGSLDVNVNTPPQVFTDGGGNQTTVSYNDSVALATTNGTMSETYEMPCVGPPAIGAPNVNGNYLTVAYSPNGQTPGSALNPNLCNVNAPTAGMTFDRRWVIEQDQPVAGARRITVKVTLMDKTIQPAVTFQMSMVRP